MRKLSVFQTVLLAVFGALAISGVLIFALVVGGAGGNEIGPVTIWGTLEDGAFRTVLRQAAENDSQLAQVTYEEKDEATYEEELTEALAEGTGPDIFIMSQAYAVHDAGKAFVVPYDRLSEAQFRNTFVESANPYLTPEGVLAFPLLADPLVLYWNRDMLASAGYSSPPRYWDEFQNLARNITQRNDAGQITKSAVALGEYRNITHAKDILTTLLLQAGVSITARDDAGSLTPALQARSGAGAREAESAVRFYTEFADPSKAIYSWNRSFSESRAAFAAGDVALYLGPASEKLLIESTNPNLNFAAAPMPQIRTADRSLTSARIHALAVSRTSRNPAGALVAATLLASAEVSRGLSIVYGIPSARRDVLNESTSGDDELFRTQAIISRAWIDPDPSETDEVFRAMIENVTSGSLRLEEAIGRAQEELEFVMRGL